MERYELTVWEREREDETSPGGLWGITQAPLALIMANFQGAVGVTVCFSVAGAVQAQNWQSAFNQSVVSSEGLGPRVEKGREQRASAGE